MAVATNELFNVSQDFFSPSILQKISSEINQPIELTKVALKSVIPTLLVGLVNKGSTREGAATIYTLANKQSPRNGISTDVIDSVKGSEYINGIFGGNLNNVISILGENTGMTRASVTKMLSLAASPLMGIINSKVKRDHLSVSGLMNFFRQQRPAISSFAPVTVASFPSAPASVRKNKISWTKVLFLALIAALVVWALNTITFFKMNRVAEDSPPIRGEIPLVVARHIGELETFMSAPLSAGKTQRFRFDSLTFGTGIAKIAPGAEYEITRVVEFMKKHPATTLRLEGYTDNVGMASANKTLSQERAAALRMMLVSRGISASRIEAVGMGETHPIETNSTVNGRAANRRIEFVINR